MGLDDEDGDQHRDKKVLDVEVSEQSGSRIALWRCVPDSQMHANHVHEHEIQRGENYGPGNERHVEVGLNELAAGGEVLESKESKEETDDEPQKLELRTSVYVQTEIGSENEAESRQPDIDQGRESGVDEYRYTPEGTARMEEEEERAHEERLQENVRESFCRNGSHSRALDKR